MDKILYIDLKEQTHTITNNKKNNMSEGKITHKSTIYKASTNSVNGT